jgi:hypothetical protein
MSIKQAIMGGVCLAMLLVLCGLSLTFSISISLFIALSLGVTITMEPDNALKRLLARYGKVIATALCTAFLVMLVDRLAGFQIMAFIRFCLFGSGTGLDYGQIIQLTGLLTILFGSFSYLVFYGEEKAGKYRKVMMGIVALACLITVWQAKSTQIQNTSVSVSKVAVENPVIGYFSTVAGNVGQMFDRQSKRATINSNETLWAFATEESLLYEQTGDTFSVLVDQKLLKGKKILVRQDAPTEKDVFGQTFVSVVLQQDDGSYSLPDPSKYNVWIGAESIVFRQESLQVAKTNEPPAPTPDKILLPEDDSLPQIDLRPSPTPTSTESNRDSVVVEEGVWAKSTVVPNKGDKIRLGYFPSRDHVSRLEVKVDDKIHTSLNPMWIDNGKRWYAILDSSANRSAPLEFRVKHGPPLTVEVTKT